MALGPERRSEMYDNVLLPTDASECSEVAVEYGLDVARRYGATVHALYVVDVRLAATGPLVDSLEAEGKHAIRDIEAEATKAGLNVVKAMATGRPSEEILAYVEKNDIDLVVMGTHGRTGFDRFVLGSVAQRVLRGSAAPVLTVKAADEAG